MSVIVINRDGSEDTYPDGAKWVIDEIGHLHVVKTNPTHGANRQPVNENVASHATGTWVSVHRAAANND